MCPLLTITRRNKKEKVEDSWWIEKKEREIISMKQKGAKRKDERKRVTRKDRRKRVRDGGGEKIIIHY